MKNLDIESSDIIRLIQHHLTECGLHESCRVLREESGIGASATFSNLKSLASAGRWGEVLNALSLLDPNVAGLQKRLTPDLIADVHEMAILELAEMGELAIAHGALRLLASSSTNELEGRKVTIENKLHSLDAIRKQHHSNSNNSNSESAPTLSPNTSTTASNSTPISSATVLPLQYYEKDNYSISRQKKRDDIAERLTQAIPMAPRKRLISLLQQSIKWQSHTGQLPLMQMAHSNMEQDEQLKEDLENQKRKKKSKRRRIQTEFDLVLGDAAIQSKSTSNSKKSSSLSDSNAEKIPKREGGKIKFGTQTQPESALFLPNGSALISGSSDGFIEIWDTHKWGKLITSAPYEYQQKDDFMYHDNSSSVLALALSNSGDILASGSSDGALCIWNISDGKCLRMFKEAHGKAISCIGLSRDGSHVLTGSHDTYVREFGLRASRMLKEFQGHESYVNTCSYIYDSADVTTHRVWVVTSSADATVRIWDGKTSELKRVIHPHLSPVADTVTKVSQNLSMSMLVDASSGTSSNFDNSNKTNSMEDGISGRNIHSVLHLHTPENSMIVVPRGLKAYLMNYNGTILKIYERFDKTSRGIGSGCDFVSATVSPSNKWLYLATEDGYCLCFQVNTGSIESTLKIMEDGKENKETIGLIHHPHMGVIASFDNNMSSPGVIKIWK